MCQIIGDSQFVHNAQILAETTQPYSKTVSFAETQCGGEVNIYLHNLTLLSDSLIFFFPVTSPSSFTLLPSPPRLGYTNVVVYQTRLPPKESGLGDPDDAARAPSWPGARRVSFPPPRGSQSLLSRSRPQLAPGWHPQDSLPSATQPSGVFIATGALPAYAALRRLLLSSRSSCLLLFDLKFTGHSFSSCRF